MRFEVLLPEAAVADLEEIYDYIAERDTPRRAGYVLEQIEKAITSLGNFPGRGGFAKELLSLGIRDYRQTYFKPYHVIYRIAGKRVYVYLIADGQRDMQVLLSRRLLGT